jgi:uncharacterized protein
MTEHEAWDILAQKYLGRAEESFATAQLSVEKGFSVSAINRLYYTLFYIVSGLLIKTGKSYHKHSAVRAAVHRDLVQNGIVSGEFGRLFDLLFEDRLKGDYMPETQFSVAEIADLSKQTGQFLTELKEKL